MAISYSESVFDTFEPGEFWLGRGYRPVTKKTLSTYNGFLGFTSLLVHYLCSPHHRYRPTDNAAAALAARVEMKERLHRPT